MRAAALVLLALGLAAPASTPAYHVVRAQASREALLAADETAWAAAQSVSWGPRAYDTRFRASWDDTGLWLRFDATDPSPWNTMSKRDEHLWEEEVVEIFIDLDRSGKNYYELEISPANVICDLRMISASPKQGELVFDLAGLVSRVDLRKDKAGRTTGWTATAFLPWEGFRPLPSAKAIALPPKAKDAWRFNVFRIKRPGGASAPEKGAVEVAWSKPPGPSFHAPEVFRDLVFE
ncbi:MAG TPA: carbohydrate-binding family 9-like protein [Vicinamibacteria bacterium]|nr:carbohydrate-binding family 9-like protein [Vicinamibacteria bacterium]